MHRLRPRALCDREQSLDIQIALCRRRSSYVVRLVGETYMKRLPVRIRVHREACHSHLPERTDDADGYLPTVRDQDFLEHLNHILPARIGPQGALQPHPLRRLMPKQTGEPPPTPAQRSELLRLFTVLRCDRQRGHYRCDFLQARVRFYP